ncbi:MAG: hypothetical protein ACJ72N_27505 [Labedaea sp.]
MTNAQDDYWKALGHLRELELQLEVAKAEVTRTAQVAGAEFVRDWTERGDALRAGFRADQDARGCPR